MIESYQIVIVIALALLVLSVIALALLVLRVFRWMMASGKFCVPVGFVSVMLGLFVGLWARAHSPHMSWGEMVMKIGQPGAYVLKEPFYIIVCLFAGGLVLTGLAELLRGVVLSTIADAHPRVVPPPMPRYLNEDGCSPFSETGPSDEAGIDLWLTQNRPLAQ